MTLVDVIKQEIKAIPYWVDSDIEDGAKRIIAKFESLIDEQLSKVRDDLASAPDPSDWWLFQGEAHALKDLKEKL